MTATPDRPGLDQLTSDQLDRLYAERDQCQAHAEQLAAELENVRRSFPMGVKPALVKTLAAVDGHAYGRLGVAERKRYREQADAVLRLMGWREKQLTDQRKDVLQALRATEATLTAVRDVLAHWDGSDVAYGRFATELRAALDQHGQTPA
ncbi:hypothetical protein MIU24_32470 [Streptomyces venezuelae]|uniref:hypothetical protein n=1 Tax=Streptomyces sp. B6(2022) TaxID=3404749 RepID=UPI00312044B4